MKIEQIPPGLVWWIEKLVVCDIEGCLQESKFFYVKPTQGTKDAYTWSLCEDHAKEYAEREDV